MIYLIITTSIHNKFGLQNNLKRKEDYVVAITESLLHVPPCITPIIVENNGLHATYLDYFMHNGKKVPVIYTNNNKYQFKSKGINEALDIKEVILKMNIQNNDMIIKLTGRYKVLSPLLFNEVIEHEKINAFVKFYDVTQLKEEKYNCVLGFYAIRCLYFKLWNCLSIQRYDSAEVAFAKYVKTSGLTYKSMDALHIECCFADDNRKLVV